MSLPRRQPKARASASTDLAFAKPAPRAVRPRVKTLARHSCRRPLEKPPLGAATAGHRATSRKQKGIELLAKTASKIRDVFRCQVPGCAVRGRGAVESAHIVDAGMGGRFSVSNLRRCFVTVCHDHHQGRRSIHTTHLEMRPQSAEAGGDGKIDWWTRTRKGNTWSPWTHIGTTAPALLPPFASRS